MRTTTAPTTVLTAADLDQLAQAVATDGIAAHESALRRLATAVRTRLGSTRRTDVAVEVMLDPHAPAVARSRAFGVVSAALVVTPAEATTSRSRHLAA